MGVVSFDFVKTKPIYEPAVLYLHVTKGNNKTIFFLL